MPTLTKTIRDEEAQREREEQERKDREREEETRRVQEEAERVRAERIAERTARKDAALKEAYTRFKSKAITAAELTKEHGRIYEEFDAEEEQEDEGAEDVANTLRDDEDDEDVRMKTPEVSEPSIVGEKRKRANSGLREVSGKVSMPFDRILLTY
jgi:hypothetical protein